TARWKTRSEDVGSTPAPRVEQARREKQRGDCEAQEIQSVPERHLADAERLEAVRATCVLEHLAGWRLGEESEQRSRVPGEQKNRERKEERADLVLREARGQDSDRGGCPTGQQEPDVRGGDETEVQRVKVSR